MVLEVNRRGVPEIAVTDWIPFTKEYMVQMHECIATFVLLANAE